MDVFHLTPLAAIHCANSICRDRKVILSYICEDFAQLGVERKSIRPTEYRCYRHQCIEVRRDAVWSPARECRNTATRFIWLSQSRVQHFGTTFIKRVCVVHACARFTTQPGWLYDCIFGVAGRMDLQIGRIIQKTFLVCVVVWLEVPPSSWSRIRMRCRWCRCCTVVRLQLRLALIPRKQTSERAWCSHTNVYNVIRYAHSNLNNPLGSLCWSRVRDSAAESRSCVWCVHVCLCVCSWCSSTLTHFGLNLRLEHIHISDTHIVVVQTGCTLCASVCLVVRPGDSVRSLPVAKLMIMLQMPHQHSFESNATRRNVSVHKNGKRPDQPMLDPTERRGGMEFVFGGSSRNDRRKLTNHRKIGFVCFVCEVASNADCDEKLMMMMMTTTMATTMTKTTMVGCDYELALPN